MSVNSQKLASWLAILSLIFSSVLTISHNHGQSCGCDETGTAHVTATKIAGLENLPSGDCDCDGCETTPEQQDHQHSNEDHDEDTCSICRMVYESGEEFVEFELPVVEQTICNSTLLIVVALVESPTSEYLTRGPPALSA